MRRVICGVLMAVGVVACGDEEGATVRDTADARLVDTGDGSSADTAVADTNADAQDPDAGDAGEVRDAGDATDTSDTRDPDDTKDASETGDTSDTVEPSDTAETSDTADAQGEVDTAVPCEGLAAGHARHVVLSYPYTAAGGSAKAWKVLALEADGSLGAVTDTLTMGRAVHGRIAFTPDGRLGFAPQDNGTLGVFAFDAQGRAKVLAAELDPGVYATAVAVDGDRLLLVNPNWAESGGGVYAAALDCDGNVGPAARLYTAKNAVDVAVRGNGDHLVVARAAGDATFGHLHQLRAGSGAWTRVDSVDLFGHDEAILTAIALMADERFALVAQNSEFSAEPNAIGVARLDGAGLLAEDPIEVNDPVSLVASPYGDAALVVSGYGNAVRILSYDPAASTPIKDLGEPAYIVSRPSLPGDAVLVGASHPGQVLVVENVAVRRFRFDPKAKLVDLGRTAAGSGTASIPGAIGVQP